MKMNKAMLFAAIIFTAIATFTSCIIEEGGGSTKKATLAGVIIYDHTVENISTVIEITDLALKLDKYISAPENEKAGIAAKYFPGYIMTLNAGQWSIKAPYETFIIKPGSNSVHTVGSKWEARSDGPVYTSNYMTTPIFVEIECTGDKAWKLSVHEKTGYNINFDADFTISGSSLGVIYPYALYEYMVNGGGNYEPFETNRTNDYFHVDYTIKTPMKFVNRAASSNVYTPVPFIAISGKIEMLVSDDVLSSSLDHIIVEVVSQSSFGVTKIVTFNGITETWSN